MAPLFKIFLVSFVLSVSAHSQVVQVPPFTGSAQEGFESHIWGSFLPCLTPRVFGATADLCTPGRSGSHVTIAWHYVCSIYPHTGAQLSASSDGPYEFTFDTPVTRFGGYFGTNCGSNDIAIRFYDAAHVQIANDTVSATLSCTWTWNGWQITAPGGATYIQLQNAGCGGGYVMVDDLEIDHALPTPPPTCVLTGPVSTVMGDASFQINTTSMSSPAVDIMFDFSIDAGLTYNACTASASSALPSPAAGVPAGIASFTWDTVADGVGVLAPQAGVLVRATIDDGVAPLTGECLSAAFDVDNSALCSLTCGDCNLNGLGPDILDALQAAQFSAGLGVPTMPQLGCCDVNSSSAIEILDALLIAQDAAGLPTALACL